MPQTYTTIFNTQIGATPESYEVTLTWDDDFNVDGKNDIKIEICHTTNQSGAEDTLGVAFDINQSPGDIGFISDLVIDQISITGSVAGPNPFPAPVSAIDYDEVGDGGPPGTFDTMPGLDVSGASADALEPFDAFVKVNEGGAGDGSVNKFEFILSSPSQDLDISLLENTDWFIRTQTTEGGDSAKTSGAIGDIPDVICFLAGTKIATPDGERNVENLSIGDLVTTQGGAAVPVKWIGRQTMTKLFTPRHKFTPVRVRAGALGGGLPHTDLLLTADHALILQGLAINAGALVNGTTIAYEPFQQLPARLVVYHVETEDHNVILANGAPAETYVDYLERKLFDNYAEYVDLYGEGRTIREMPIPRISSASLLPPVIRRQLNRSDVA